LEYVSRVKNGGPQSLMTISITITMPIKNTTVYGVFFLYIYQ